MLLFLLATFWVKQGAETTSLLSHFLKETDRQVLALHPGFFITIVVWPKITLEREGCLLMQMELCPWIFLLNRNIQRKRSWQAGTEHPAPTCCCADCKVLWVRTAPSCFIQNCICQWGEHHPPWGHSHIQSVPFGACEFPKDTLQGSLT